MTGPLVWADDLTGAAEVAVAIGRAVSLEDPPLDDDAVHDLHCRHLDPQAAYEHLVVRLDRLPAEADLRLKIDSQANGPVPAYLQALRDHGRPAVVCLANPATGRFTAGGVHYIPDGAGYRTLDLAETHPTRGGTILSDSVVDARTSQDLERVARTALGQGLTLVGSAPFVSVGLDVGIEPAPQAPHADALLVVIGSDEPLARAQVGALDPAVVVEPADQAGADLHAALATHGVAVLAGHGHDAADLAATAAQVLDRAPHRQTAVAASGGHTARAVLDRLDLHRLHPTDNPVAAVTALRSDSGRLIITKPGSYGSTTTLRDLIRALGITTRQELR